MNSTATPVRRIRNLLFLAGLLLAVHILLNMTALPAYAVDPIDHCGYIYEEDETWAGDGTVHTLSCNVGINDGFTLTIAEGAIVKAGDGSGLTVGGELVVQGTAASPVTFTSIHDDSIGGDTNNNGAATIPAESDWSGIGFYHSSTSSLVDHAVVRYASDAIYLMDDASPTIRYSTLADSAKGIYLTSGDAPGLISTPSLVCNNIVGNTYGIFNYTENELIAEGQWWGDASGPSGWGPGSGDAVSAYVDFEPWATSPCVGPPDLALTLTASPDPVFRGDQLTYTATITNLGDGAATGVTLGAWTFMNWLNWSAATPSAGTCLAGIQVQCEFDAIPAGETVIVIMTGTVDPAAGSTLETNANVHTTEVEVDDTNNETVVTTSVWSRLHLPLLTR